MYIYTMIVFSLMLMGSGLALAENKPKSLTELFMLLPIIGRVLGWW